MKVVTDVRGIDYQVVENDGTNYRRSENIER